MNTYLIIALLVSWVLGITVIIALIMSMAPRGLGDVGKWEWLGVIFWPVTVLLWLLKSIFRRKRW